MSDVAPTNGENAVPLVVLPSIRLSRLTEALTDILGDRKLVHQVMDAVEDHLERDTYRWGNACPREDCRAPLEWREQAGHVCPVHGYLGAMASTDLLIAFRPCTPPVGRPSDG